LLNGELTLVECFARTNPFNSWMMTLIGDPLYRPFKYRVPVQLPTETGRQAPTSPSLSPTN
ncbi:MAG TPA: hypothetical protein VHK01_09770, partial [Lacipirellulaceae bacterium]|nr:hypothetical protein [Lacipirellulaceae bacterium]